MSHEAPPRNFLGHDGALIADLLMQGIGVAAYLVPSALLGWAFRLLLLLALLLAAAGCAILRIDLPLPAGAGGAFGATLQRLGFPASLMLPGPQAYVSFALIAGSALATAFFFARLTERNTASFRRFLSAHIG